MFRVYFWLSWIPNWGTIILWKSYWLVPKCCQYHSCTCCHSICVYLQHSVSEEQACSDNPSWNQYSSAESDQPEETDFGNASDDTACNSIHCNPFPHLSMEQTSIPALGYPLHHSKCSAHAFQKWECMEPLQASSEN